MNQKEPLKEEMNQKETLAQVFFCEISEISNNTFFIEHLRTTASVLTQFQTSQKAGIL